jgi:hypothetical protein
MTTPRTSAMKATVVPKRFRQPHGLSYQIISELVIASLTVFICATAPALAIPVPPGVGAGSSNPSSARSGSQGPRCPMQIAAAQTPGCNGVIATKGQCRR